jgi:protein TonB
MSYKSLLYCPDEKAARVVTQVLSELEFTVELSNEPFAAVKTLTDEHFDALVVDCQNEQDAGLLFKAARNSNLNHSSLSVAVVEGQAGVAKAFRIGANLVLTKPVNLEQSKSTLRVARGLLRKNETKVGGAPAATSVTAQAPVVLPTPAKPLAREAAASSALNSVAHPAVAPVPKTEVPYSGLEVEEEPTPVPEPSEVALLESLPVNGKPVVAESAWAPRAQAGAEPIAASTARHGAGVAPALIKKPEPRFSGASPMITNEPIVQKINLDEPLPELSVPMFAALQSAHSSSGGGSKFVKIVLVLVVLGVAGYFGWQRFQPLQYLHRSTPAATPGQTAAPAEPAPAPASAPVTPAAQAPADQQAEPSGTAPATTTPDENAAPSGPSASASQPASAAPEMIRVQELAMSSEQKTALPKRPAVIQVKASGHTAPKAPGGQSQPTPPALTLNSGGSDAALNTIVAADAPAPRPSPGVMRVSQGVSQGLVVRKVAPVYSQTALQLHKEGAVELMAPIGKDGAVTGVRVLSGDLMLANSAVEAVKQWKYRPYLLNGEPVEIQTQITVNFKMPR